MADTLVYIGLGANLAQPVQQLEQAVLALQRIKQTTLAQVSGFYSSKPMGPQDQPDYVNAVAALHTRLAAEDLLTELQQIELEQGRQRKDERWGPRTLDLDILLFGNNVIQTERLIVPHYGMKQREFVLYPLAELNSNLVLPDGTRLTELLTTVPLNGLTRL
jgi:2-amino-4-hydroxy-6-hydroxymethyldihydropteridine diphosphokinase